SVSYFYRHFCSRSRPAHCSCRLPSLLFLPCWPHTDCREQLCRSFLKHCWELKHKSTSKYTTNRQAFSDASTRKLTAALTPCATTITICSKWRCNIQNLPRAYSPLFMPWSFVLSHSSGETSFPPLMPDNCACT